MPLLLNIDTATEHASVCLSRDETVLGLIESTEQKNHASFVQPAIQKLMQDSGLTLTQLDAVAVTAGPGSYTGLRVGLATAKGICYALNKPLIMINTLEVMAQSVISQHEANHQQIDANTLVCPMIDARRMEVFTALYTARLAEIQAPHALVLNEQSFQKVLIRHSIIFSGSGHHKLKGIVTDSNTHFSTANHSAAHLAILALQSYQISKFANLAYSEPLYVKEFFNPLNKA